MTSQRPEVRRQERGRQRIEQILRAAADVFAAYGYEKATTNAIASRAHISPGSLYQFFRDKDDIARSLAESYVSELQGAQSEAFGRIGSPSVRDAVEQVIDPLVEFNVAHPGFKALFARTDMPASFQAAVAPMHEAIQLRTRATIAALSPALDDDELDRTTTVTIQIVRAMMPPIVSAGDGRAPLVDELKTVLISYLEAHGASAARGPAVVAASPEHDGGAAG